MTQKLSYSEKLKSPLWQKKRLLILERDNWTCQDCKLPADQLKEQLHVHHQTYVWGKEPWDYPDKNLITLCASCHESREEQKVTFQDMVHDLLIEGYTYGELAKMLSQLIHPIKTSRFERIEMASYCSGNDELLGIIKKYINGAIEDFPS